MIFKGNFFYTPALGELTVREGEYLVVEGEKCARFTRGAPPGVRRAAGDRLRPGAGAPRLLRPPPPRPPDGEPGRGLRPRSCCPGWRPTPSRVEARYGDTDFAEAAWKRSLNRMWANGTLRFSAFATIHKEAAWRLMELTERAGLSALIGKVNMDRNAPDSLREDTDASLWRTRRS